MFPCEYCEIFKNNYFKEDLRTAAPVSPTYEDTQDFSQSCMFQEQLFY